jgi:hypothetical protein
MATPAQIAANHANSKLSTGPTSAEGKARSSRNSFKHGIYSKDLVLPHEDPAELDRLRASLRVEHQPINTTEEILVNDLAENFWRLRRMREREAFAMQPENIHVWHDSGLLGVVQRTMASAERDFHKSLAALRRLQKDRGFVPQPTDPAEHEIGFVPQQSEQLAADTGSMDQIGFASPQAEQLAVAKAALLEEMRPFRDESGRISQENFQAFAEHMRKKCLAQLDRLPKAA